MNKFKEEIIEEKFDYSLYKKDCNFRLFTNGGSPVDIMDSIKLDKLLEDISYVGSIDLVNHYEINVWDKNGVSVDGNKRKDIKMVKSVKPNYDNITFDDVPDTDEFRKEYEDFCKYSFKMSDVEYLRYKEFLKDHKDCGRNNGAIGGGTSVSFMGTGLGNIVHVKCENCGLEVDITDNTCW